MGVLSYLSSRWIEGAGVTDDLDVVEHRTPEARSALGDLRSQEFPVPGGRSGGLPRVAHLGRPRTELRQRPRPGAASRFLHRHQTGECPGVQRPRDAASRPQRRPLLAHRPHATRSEGDALHRAWTAPGYRFDAGRLAVRRGSRPRSSDQQAEPGALRQRERVVGRGPDALETTRPSHDSPFRRYARAVHRLEQGRASRPLPPTSEGYPQRHPRRSRFHPPGFGHRLHMGQIQTEALEREVKFGAPLGVGLPDLRDLVSRTERLPRQQLQTAYFDTPDGRLWDQGITLASPDDTR